jgi:hypothetical protein
MSREELRERIIKILNLDETPRGQLVPKVEDMNADWSIDVEEIFTLLDTYTEQHNAALARMATSLSYAAGYTDHPFIKAEAEWANNYYQQLEQETKQDE